MGLQNVKKIHYSRGMYQEGSLEGSLAIQYSITAKRTIITAIND